MPCPAQRALRHRFQQTGRLLIASCLAIAAPSLAEDWIYTVVEGDNLWDLSTRYLDTTMRYERLRQLNDIEYPRRMQPGTRIRVPMAWIRSNPVEAEIAAVAGQAQLFSSDGQMRRVEAPGVAIGLGDRLVTQANSSVAVRFADGSVVTVHQESEMAFDHLSAHGETGMVDSRLRLLDGRLDTRVTPAVGPGSRFEIHTPSAISAVRGTDYRAAVIEEGRVSNIEVTGGRVAVTGAQRSRLVRRGFGTQVALDAPPAKPRPLLPPPAPEPFPTPIRMLDEPLQWAAIDGARSYRAEIASDVGFDVLIFDRVVDRPRLRLPDLPDGDYQLRLRAIDELGLEGRDRVVALSLDTHPRPPVPLLPNDGQVLRGQTGDLRWTDSADAAAYRLEIARDPDFAELVARHDDLSSTLFETDQTLAPGVYYWRVSSLAADGELGPPSAVRFWDLKPIPDAVEAELAADDEQLVATWRSAGPGMRYQVQIARDTQFRDRALDEVIESPRLAIEQTPGQVRYLRVRVVEGDGYLGPWGAVQRIDPPYDPTVWMVPILGILGILLL